MNRSRRSWLIFAACAVVMAGAMIWISSVAVRLERAEARASAEMEFQEAQQRALWRMDSWLSMFVAREAARPYAEYLPYAAAQPGSLLGSRRTPSPLLELESDYVRLHFHADPVAGISSPQVPALGDDPWPAELAAELLETRRAAWSALRPYLDLNTIQTTMALAESLPTTKLASGLSQTWFPQRPQLDAPATALQTEFNARVQCTVPPPPGQAVAAGVTVDVGPLIPQWLKHPDRDEHQLVFVRRIQSQGKAFYQGFFGNWPELRSRLLVEIVDLFPDAELARVSPETMTVDPFGRYLANIPVALIASAPPVAETTRITPTRITLALAWLVTFGAALTVGLTLHKSLELGERRRRFVSAVTHELRTPLTTFRMYSEMLADGMVQGDRQRQEYLETLKDESSRLAAMVDNVLMHSRLEEGRAARNRESLTVDRLLARVMPPLVRQLESCGMALETDTYATASTTVVVDVDAVARILRNLVDNATKYAGEGESPTVLLRSELENGSLIVEVRDHGPGVSVRQARAIFQPFDRGGRDPADPVSGIGLGLALARGLARDMGGDLKLENPSDGGACFRLSLPVEPDTEA